MGFFRLLFLFLIVYFLVKTARRLITAYFAQQQSPRKFTRNGGMNNIEEADYEIIEPKKNSET